MVESYVHKISCNCLARISILLLFAFFQLSVSAQTLYDPVIDSISVMQTPNHGFKMVVGWQPYDWTGFDEDSVCFVVYEVVPTGYRAIDTIYNFAATFYMDMASEPELYIYRYGLATSNLKVGGSIIPTVELYSRNMRLRVVEYDSCTTSVTVNWNTYFGDEASPDQIDPIYQVIAVSETDRRVETSSDTAYTMEGLNVNEHYLFKVRVATESWSSTSAPVSLFTESPSESRAPVIRTLSTESDFSSTVTAQIDLDNVVGVELLTSNLFDGIYSVEDSVEATQQIISLSDDNTEEASRFFSVRSWDVCGVDVSSEFVVNSIIMTVLRTTDFIRIMANTVDNFDGTYTLIRRANGTESHFSLEPPLEFTDTEIFDMTLEHPEVSYRISCNVGDTLNILSNPYTTRISDDLRWPNAIIAGHYGDDGAFRPYSERSIPEVYNLKIYSKWGELIFESHNIEDAWRADYKGAVVMPGAYLYVAEYRFEGKRTQVVKGTVTVIH